MCTVRTIVRGDDMRREKTWGDYISSDIGTVRAPFVGRRRAAQGSEGQRRAAQGRRIIKNSGRRIIKNSGRRIIKNSGRRIIINIRHNYMHDVKRSKSGGLRRNEEE